MKREFKGVLNSVELLGDGWFPTSVAPACFSSPGSVSFCPHCPQKSSAGEIVAPQNVQDSMEISPQIKNFQRHVILA
jgi:hypothetical protein